MDKYAMYLRKSRADLEAEKLGEGETLARHKKILTELAAKKSLYVDKIYQEIVSGETVAARPQMQKLIKDCYAGNYRGIIVIDIDRLSRGNQGDMQTIMDCLRYSNDRNGLLVVTPTKTYDVSHNADDEEYMEFVLFMSRREYKTIQKRLERGRNHAVVEGNYMAAYRPYGYNIMKTKSGRTLVPNEKEAPIVKSIFEWTIKENLTPGKIARRLDAMGVTTYSGDPEWSTSTIKTILKNPTYAGKVRWNDRMQVKKMVDGKIVTSRPRSNHTEHYMLYEGKHAAIISEEEFEAAGKRFYSDRTKGNLKLKNPFAGIIVCKNCQKTMLYNSYKHQKNTAPRILHRQSQICKVKSAPLEEVTSVFVQSLSSHIEDFKVKMQNAPSMDKNTIQGQIEALQAELKRTEKKITKLFDAWEDGVISNNDFVQRKAVHTEKAEKIQQQIESMEKSIPEKENYEERIVMFSEAIETLLNPSIDASIKNKYLKGIIQKIEFSRDSNNELVLDIHIKQDGSMV